MTAVQQTHGCVTAQSQPKIIFGINFILMVAGALCSILAFISGYNLQSAIIMASFTGLTGIINFLTIARIQMKGIRNIKTFTTYMLCSRVGSVLYSVLFAIHSWSMTKEVYEDTLVVCSSAGHLMTVNVVLMRISSIAEFVFMFYALRDFFVGNDDPNLDPNRDRACQTCDI